ncbi:carboxymuconolactone decarboxylase family protein [Clostridium aciditolerans]|uniref:Carboxymuconolactone decarboxylase family protein n=1 Tax=Clostridium aciditolerans TaxID=339861 RepID=A0A934HP57_9CLOT|nr:carboxymuconolactone decarboxylase family protein [Clostridium aciditolerans]MBI6871760.1 carboxymuconolactone decarboxylase family protein [Clostridium aciditolerans]
MNKDYQKGIDVLKEMTDINGQQTVKSLGEIFPDFEEKMIAFGFGQIYSRENLDLKTREVVTITALITQGAFEQLDFHIKAALKVGLKPEEILEIILHCAAYVGFPKACSALVIAGQIFKNNEV